MKLTEENYVEKAEEVIKQICEMTSLDEKHTEKGKCLVTTSKIRNLLSMVSDIYNRVVNSTDERLEKSIINDINYMKIRFIYEAGREKTVALLIETAELLVCLEESKKNRAQYILFSRYMEALVAYRKYYGEMYGNEDE